MVLMQVCQDRQINFPDIFIPQKGQQRHFPLISAASRIQDNAFPLLWRVQQHHDAVGTACV